MEGVCKINLEKSVREEGFFIKWISSYWQKEKCTHPFANRFLGAGEAPLGFSIKGRDQLSW